eukprot:Hpha_TRINITY_DN13178_c0_g1::TRINITY_DN13178_c0_g1_i2::g.113913::m.113913
MSRHSRLALLCLLCTPTWGADDPADGLDRRWMREARGLANLPTTSPEAATGSGTGATPTTPPVAAGSPSKSPAAGTGTGSGTGTTTTTGSGAGTTTHDTGGSAGGHDTGHGAAAHECPSGSGSGSASNCFIAQDRMGQCLKSNSTTFDVCKLTKKNGFNVCELETTCPCHEHEHAHDPPFNIIVLTAMMLIGNLCRRFGHIFPLKFLPYTVQLFLLGAGWGALASAAGWKNYEHLSEIDPHLMFYIFLPLLIFESAFATEYHVFKKVVWHALFLAGPGLITSSFLTALVAKFAFNAYQWSWVTCLLFGCMLSATDPVAVVALLKELGAAPTISALIEGESLLNDGTAIVFFNIFKSGVATGVIDMTILEILLELVKVAGGGPVIGLLVGIVTKKSIKLTFNDPAIEITLTLVAAYATFFMCEGYFGVSGVLGLVILGMYLAYHSHVISPEVEHSLHQFWEIIVYMANTMIFAIAGLIIAEKAFQAVSPRDFGYLMVLYVSVNIIRGFGLFLFRNAMNSLGQYQLDRANGILCTWGGLRGAVGLALALIVLGDAEILCAFPDLGARFLFHTAGIVALTLMVNGVTTGMVVGRLGLTQVSHSRKYAMQNAFKNLMEFAEHQQVELRRQPVFRDAHWSKVRERVVTDLHDPHNARDEVVSNMDIQVDACEHYYRAYATAVEHEYEAGTMRASSQRMLLAYLADAEDKAHVHDLWEMIESKVLEGLFVITWKETMPGMGGMNGQFVHAFDVCIGFLNTHQFILDKIAAMCHRQQASSRVKDHCKRVRNETVMLVERISTEHPEISTSIKSTNASRNVLNAMRNTVIKSQHMGKITAADAGNLRRMVETAMDRLRKIPRKLNPAFHELTLCQLCPWYSKLPACHEKLQMMFSVEKIEKSKPIVGEFRDGSGAFVVLSGVARVNIGNRAEHFGPGYTAGLLGLLTDKRGRFSEVYAETTCTVAYFPELSLRTLLQENPDFNNLVWDEACRSAARCILSVLTQYRDWDHVRIANYVKKGFRVTVPEAQMYPIQVPPMHCCILINGKWKDTLMGNSTGDGPCFIPKQFEDIYCWESPVLFAIPSPLTVSEKARNHWKKIMNSLFVARAVATLQGHDAGKIAVQKVLAGEFFKLIKDAKLEDAAGADEWRMAQSKSVPSPPQKSPSYDGPPSGLGGYSGLRAPSVVSNNSYARVNPDRRIASADSNPSAATPWFSQGGSPQPVQNLSRRQIRPSSRGYDEGESPLLSHQGRGYPQSGHPHPQSGRVGSPPLGTSFGSPTSRVPTGARHRGGGV